ncbi:MAG TPA: hypothetical protein VKF38_17180 [Anaerolineaceae bacterium]|nr:hypothetical protein [Anaerolineaceae bacterium]
MKSNKNVIPIILLISVLMSACGLVASASAPTSTPAGAMATEFVQTIQVLSTQNAALWLSATPQYADTPTPTETSTPTMTPTATETPTPTPTLTATRVPPVYIYIYITNTPYPYNYRNYRDYRDYCRDHPDRCHYDHHTPYPTHTPTATPT